jgi:hypothetical protein
MRDETAAEILESSDDRRAGARARQTVPLTLRIRRYNPEVREDSW